MCFVQLESYANDPKGIHPNCLSNTPIWIYICMKLDSKSEVFVKDLPPINPTPFQTDSFGVNLGDEESFLHCDLI